MIKMYVMQTCPDCEYVEKQVSTWSPLPDPLYPASYREERERKGGHSEGLGY